MKQFFSLRALRLPLATAALIAPLAAAANQFFVVVPVVGRQSAPPLEEVSVTLNPGALAIASRGRPYSQDMTGYLSVTGDPSFQMSQTQWTASEELPAGLTLSAAGVLSGTPQRVTPGTDFVVRAQYKDNSAPRSYTITVNGEALAATKVVAGGAFSCAITAGGAVVCWGQNYDGQLGNGTRDASDFPVQVLGLTSGATDIAVGVNHACAIVATQTYCWGANNRGQLGIGITTQFESLPRQVVGFSGAQQIAMGADFTCGVRGGAAYCWGYNGNGILGTGGSAESLRNTPILVNTLGQGVRAITAGASHACVVVDNGSSARAACWGENYDGRLGNTATASRVEVPQTVTGLGLYVTQIDSDPTGAHTCAIQDTVVHCWGHGTMGQLGDGEARNSIEPVLTALPLPVDKISVGGTHSCALFSGSVYCWGAGANGRLGTGVTDNLLQPVVEAPTTSGVSQLDAGPYHTCIVQQGVAKCFGVGSVGRLGNGEHDDMLTPRSVIR